MIFMTKFFIFKIKRGQKANDKIEKIVTFNEELILTRREEKND